MSTAPILLPYPNQRVRLIEDWIGSSVAGNLNWNAQNAGTGAAPTISDTVMDNNHWGILEIHTGTTAAGRSGVQLSIAAGTNILKASGASGYYEWLIYIPVLSIVTERYALRIGFGDSVTADFANGSYFEYDESVSANWRAKTANASTRTTTDTGVVVAAGAWIKLRMDWTVGTNRVFSINGTTVATITTNITTNGVYPIINMIKSAGTTSRLVYADYWIMDAF